MFIRKWILPNVSNASLYALLSLILGIISTITLLTLLIVTSKKKANQQPILFEVSEWQPEVSQVDNMKKKFHYYNNFNPYKCGSSGHRSIRIHIYSLKMTENVLTKEYILIVKALKKSKYYSSSAKRSCIFVPLLDTLNSNSISGPTLKYLKNHKRWNGGYNNLIFSMPSASINTWGENAMQAKATMNLHSIRHGFDVSIPLIYTSFVDNNLDSSKLVSRPWLIISSQNLKSDRRSVLLQLAGVRENIIILEKCSEVQMKNRMCFKNKTFPYPSILKESAFCIIFKDSSLSSMRVFNEALSSGCIPVLLSYSIALPYQQVIDWKRAVIFVPENRLSSLVDYLASIPSDRREEMSAQGKWLYDKYFSSIPAIVNTTLDLLNQRVFPENALTYEEWNIRMQDSSGHSPILLDRQYSTMDKFTAVILTYDRVDSVFLLIRQLSLVPSLSTILVIWNNQQRPPPSSYLWPKSTKAVKILRTRKNIFSNRFYPYKEIETDAVLSLDDDITMLTVDELEFGFRVWREFPDRLVGFPSRTHEWNNFTSQWKYQSEWTNEISMVLTGAAFYHKYWNYLYSSSLPAQIRAWVDTNMNCEDIAMNFLISNTTKKAPIKVAPRKKFKCPECSNVEMLSADEGHMMERSRCINEFARIYDKVPLKPVQFRADPVLFKVDVSDKEKWYRDVGSL